MERVAAKALSLKLKTLFEQPLSKGIRTIRTVLRRSPNSQLTKTHNMKDLLPQLMAQVKAELDRQGYGSRKALAEWLQVRPQKINDWLTGVYLPNGESALQLQTWLNSKHLEFPDECPLRSISTSIATMPNDWSLDHREAWIYGITNGWNDEALDEIQKRLKWNPALADRLKRLRAKWLSMEHPV